MSNPFKILLVDDDPTVIGVLGRMLQGLGSVCFATSGADALRIADQSAPDLVMLDIEMPGMSGYEVCSAMKAVPQLADVPVIFLTSHADEDAEVAGFGLGASDFISKPPRAAQVAARVRMHLRLKQRADALRSAAFTDALTGIASRRQFDETLAREWRQSERKGAPIALMMFDVDVFKQYNDCYGHPAGDECLRAVARCLRLSVRRPTDLVARYGGEEFTAVLPDTARDGAEVVARRVFDGIAALALPHEASPVAPCVTLSVGIAVRDAGADGASFEAADLVTAADRALYAAKLGGRRRACYVALGSPSGPGPCP